MEEQYKYLLERNNIINDDGHIVVHIDWYALFELKTVANRFSGKYAKRFWFYKTISPRLFITGRGRILK